MEHRTAEPIKLLSEFESIRAQHRYVCVYNHGKTKYNHGKTKVFDTNTMQFLSEGELNNNRQKIVMTTPGPHQSVYMVAEPGILFGALAANPRESSRKSNLVHPCQRSAGVAVNAKCLVVSGNGS